jgi:hypothetical protein
MSITIPTISLAGAVASVTLDAGPGVANSGVTATESNSGGHRVTKLTFTNLSIGAVAGAADQALGKLLYTLPAGAAIVRAAHMEVALTSTEALIDADTPDVGLGTLLASGAQALLSGVGAAAENILTGQTFPNTTGTQVAKGVNDQMLDIKPTDSHAIHLNVADGWAGADSALKASGTVLLEWVHLS